METETGQATTSSAERVLEVAKQQKRLIWLILAQLVLFLFVGPLLKGSPVRLLMWLILGVILAYLTYRIG